MFKPVKVSLFSKHKTSETMRAVITSNTTINKMTFKKVVSDLLRNLGFAVVCSSLLKVIMYTVLYLCLLFFLNFFYLDQNLLWS